MQPADIYQGQALGTNAAHLGAYRALARMARALGESEADAARWDRVADGVAEGCGGTSGSRTAGGSGSNATGAPRWRSRRARRRWGEALAVITGAATPEQRARLMEAAPVLAFGRADDLAVDPRRALLPQCRHLAVRHRLLAWAAADAGSTAAVEHGLATLVRTTALS
jgi:hypothetical protein